MLPKGVWQSGKEDKVTSLNYLSIILIQISNFIKIIITVNITVIIIIYINNGNKCNQIQTSKNSVTRRCFNNIEHNLYETLQQYGAHKVKSNLPLTSRSPGSLSWSACIWIPVSCGLTCLVWQLDLSSGIFCAVFFLCNVTLRTLFQLLFYLFTEYFVCDSKDAYFG